MRRISNMSKFFIISIELRYKDYELLVLVIALRRRRSFTNILSICANSTRMETTYHIMRLLVMYAAAKRGRLVNGLINNNWRKFNRILLSFQRTYIQVCISNNLHLYSFDQFYTTRITIRKNGQQRGDLYRRRRAYANCDAINRALK